MSTQEAVTPSAPSARVVGNAFVEQYYHILHQSPALVHRFYQDSSLLSRPDGNGDMTTVTTAQAINDKILSLNYEDFTAEIKTADAQESYGRGVIVVVTGCLTGNDAMRRNFTQAFFLAPQEKGYFVLNDVLRYIEENTDPEPPSSAQTNKNIVNVVSASDAALPTEPEPANAPDQLAVEPETSFEKEEVNDGPEICEPSDNEGSVVEDEEAPELEPPVQPVDTAPAIKGDAPKISYASILKVAQGNMVTRNVHVPSSAPKVVPAKDPQSVPLKPRAPAPLAPRPPSNDGVPESSNVAEADGYSIYIRNLPLNLTMEQLEEVFKKFGPIKHDGIQVRSSKGLCFGFVEFESLASMQSAVEATPITVGDRQSAVEEKRATARGVLSGGRGRFSSGRGGGFPNDNFRARGSFSGVGRGFGRTDFRSQGEFSGRGRGPMGRGGEGYRAYQNGVGRSGHGGPARGPGSA